MPMSRHPSTAVDVVALLSGRNPVLSPIAGEIPREELMSTATVHGVTSLATRGAKLLGEKPLLNETQFRAATAQNLRRLQGLTDIMELLRDSGIETLSYKGPGLGGYIYGSIGLRSFGDLDLFVRPSDAIEAHNLLLRNGFAPEMQLSPAEQVSHLREGCEFNVTQSDRELHVELHWAVLPRFFHIDLPIEPFFDRRQTIKAGSEAVDIPSPADLALALFAHGTKHAWGRLRWLADIAWLLDSPDPLDWDEISERAAKHGILRIVMTGVAVAAELFATPVPSAIRDKINTDSTAQALSDKIVTALRRGVNPADRIAWLHWFWISVRERPLDRLAVAAALATQPTIRFRRYTHLSGRMDWLNRPLRLLYIAGKGIGRIVIRDSRP